MDYNVEGFELFNVKVTKQLQPSKYYALFFICVIFLYYSIEAYGDSIFGSQSHKWQHFWSFSRLPM